MSLDNKQLKYWLKAREKTKETVNLISQEGTKHKQIIASKGRLKSTVKSYLPKYRKLMISFLKRSLDNGYRYNQLIYV
jgi:hypothetical protein